MVATGKLSCRIQHRDLTDQQGLSRKLSPDSGYLKSETSLSVEEIQNPLLALAQGDENAIICMEMLLHALQVAPQDQGRVSKQ